jgi:hypothetical protein
MASGAAGAAELPLPGTLLLPPPESLALPLPPDSLALPLPPASLPLPLPLPSETSESLPLPPPPSAPRGVTVMVRANGVAVRKRPRPAGRGPLYKRAKAPSTAPLAHAFDELPAGVRALLDAFVAPACVRHGEWHRAVRGDVVLGDAADARVAAVLGVAARLDPSLREPHRAREWLVHVARHPAVLARWRDEQSVPSLDGRRLA